MAKYPISRSDQRSKREMAFHEKGGRSQFDSIVFSLNKVYFFPPSGHCRHASIRTLEERFVSLGACWAFLVSAGAAICLAPYGSALFFD